MSRCATGRFLLTTLLLASAGCATTSPFIDPVGGGSAFSFSTGRGLQDFPSTLSAVAPAVVSAMDDLKMGEVRQSQDGTIVRIEARAEDARPVTVSSFFRPRHFGNALLAAALLSVISVALDALSLIPPTIVFNLVALLAVAVFSFFALFTIAFATDRDLPPIEALKASFTTVRSDIGSTLLSWLVQFAVVLVGALLCFVGLVVAAPVALLIQVYTYRRLSGGPVAP